MRCVSDLVGRRRMREQKKMGVNGIVHIGRFPGEKETRNTGHGTRDMGHRTRNAECGTWNAERGTQNTERGTRNTGRGTQNAEHGTRKLGAVYDCDRSV